MSRKSNSQKNRLQERTNPMTDCEQTRINRFKKYSELLV